MHVLDGEGVAEHTVPGRELALEVCGPGSVGGVSEHVGSPGMPTSDALPSFGTRSLRRRMLCTVVREGSGSSGRFLSRYQTIFLAP